MRRQMSELLNSKDYDDGRKIGSEKTLRRWRSTCNGRRSFHELTDHHEHLKLQEQVRALSVVLKAALRFTENLSVHSNGDVPSGEYIVTEAGTEARRFHEPIDDVGSTVNGHDVIIIGTGTSIPHFNFQTSNYAPFMFVIGSFTKICKLLGKYKKRAVAMFYLVLEAASFLLDMFGKSKRSILLAAFLLSASGFAITMSMPTCIVRRTIVAARMHIQKLLLVVLEISFSVAQLIVTFMYFILAELGVKHNFNASVFPLVFAIIVAVFTFIYDGKVSDSSGLASTDIAPATDNQVYMPNNTCNKDAESNGSMPMRQK